MDLRHTQTTAEVIGSPACTVLAVDQALRDDGGDAQTGDLLHVVEQLQPPETDGRCWSLR